MCKNKKLMAIIKVIIFLNNVINKMILTKGDNYENRYIWW